MRLQCVLVVPLLLMVSGCAANSEATALEDCQKKAPRAVIDLRGIDSFESAEFSGVEAERRGDGDAWDITGTVALTLEGGSTTTDDFRCFAQTVDGKTYASIMDVSGEDVRPGQ